MGVPILDRYSNMNFPDYKFREFPKYVTPQNGKPVIVKDAREEREIMNVCAEEAQGIADGYNEALRLKEEEASLSNDKTALLAKAGDYGLVLDRRTSIENIKIAIAKAQAAIDDDEDMSN